MGGVRKVLRGGGERSKDLQEGRDLDLTVNGKKDPCLESCLDWTKEITALTRCEMAGEAWEETVWCRGQPRKPDLGLDPGSKELWRAGGRLLQLSECQILTGKRKILETMAGLL